MADEVTPTAPVVETPTVEEPKVEEVKEQKPVIDSKRPLNQQVDSLLKSIPEEKPKEEEKKVEEPVEEPETEVEAIEEDDEPEPKQEPLESWQKYVLDNLPNIQVVGHEEGKKDKTFTVKRLEDLPDDFEFASKRAELAFNAALSAQEINARELVGQYRQEELSRNVKEAQAQDAIDVQSDITALQREGVLPKFQYDSTDPKFNTDPAVKEANEIYDLYEKTNKAYLEAYQKTGRTYKISYRDAADKFYAAKARNAVAVAPKVEAIKQETPKPTNNERQDKAKQVSAPEGAEAEKQKLGIRSGTSLQDIYQAYKMGRI